MGGAFDDMVGQVVRLPSDERVTLLISMIGRQVATTLPRAQVVKAAQSVRFGDQNELR
jgi:transcription antitermination factor NusG